MMTERPATPIFLLTVLYALWLMCFVYSFISFAVVEPPGEGFAVGMNRILSFLGWQGIAGLLSIAVWALGKGWSRRSGVRRLTRLPIGLTLLLSAMLFGMILWSGFS